ncbi:hypothetical protein OJAV_G00009500 [Oryzias javanicus]|uniref:Uncharacterized protein n=1 Tax=Oryzias javanicus TaxID=123683 RepID=A0A437DNB1_ORYJA|nr:hypothetical protein OJAV_G00009500 [Oryzias javanicus]
MNSWRGIKGGLRPAGRSDRLKGASGAGAGPGAAHGHVQTSAADGARGGLDPPPPHPALQERFHGFALLQSAPGFAWSRCGSELVVWIPSRRVTSESELLRLW